jgi:aspartate racemase
MATSVFFSQVIAATPAQGDQDHRHILVDCYPQIPDRTEFLLGSGPDPVPAITEGIQRLTTGGATLIVIPCNTANALLARRRELTEFPILDWVTTSVVEMEVSSSIGILATSGSSLPAAGRTLLACAASRSSCLAEQVRTA